MEEESLMGGSAGPPSRFRRYFTARNVILAAIATVVLVVIIAVPIAVVLHNRANDGSSDDSLANAVKPDGIKVHLQMFQTIASDPKNKGSRSVVNGYADSAAYVMSQLAAGAGCDLTTQDFAVPIYEELQKPSLAASGALNVSFLYGVDFAGLRYGGNWSGTVSGSVFRVPNFGCNSSSYVGFQPGQIALVEVYRSSSNYSSDCSLVTQAMVAQNASAAAVVFQVSSTSLLGSRVRGPGWFPGDPLVTIPAISVSYSVGVSLGTLQPLTVTLFVNNSITIVETFNVFCETRDGDGSSKMVVGAHLDSVAEGPGLNDNGSGSASLLEIVLQWYKLGLKPASKVRFAWWGSEENGLLGSRHYVNDLLVNQPEEWDKLVLNLNFDMLASPNYNPQVHNGTLAPTPAAVPGSQAITRVFVDYFVSKSLPYVGNDMGGGSDYYPFVLAGLPAGGLSAGAGALKTEAQRTEFGGLAKAALDPCYHQSCDTIENIGWEALGELAGGAAYAIQRLAQMQNLRQFLQSG